MAWGSQASRLRGARRRRKLTDEDVAKIRYMGESLRTYAEIAAFFGVSASVVGQIIRGQRRKVAT